VSGTLIILGLLLMLLKGFNFGIDFKGGNIIHVRFEAQMTENQIRDTFKKIKDKVKNIHFGPEQLVIQAVSESQGKDFIIQYPAAAIESQEATQVNSEILKELKVLAPYREDALETANVGPTVGGEMKRQAVVASIISVIGILLYLAWRFEMQSATGAVLGLVHDLFITLGVIALLGIEFDVAVLAAIMTMLGYSVNDSIVVLDRIRENRKLMRGAKLVDIVNDSINQTLGRTINTSVTTLFTLFALLLFGGTSIHGFALVLTFGVFCGTYSSIFVASPVLLHMGPAKEEKRHA
jgi:preprotein translocase subunit SecF